MPESSRSRPKPSGKRRSARDARRKGKTVSEGAKRSSPTAVSATLQRQHTGAGGGFRLGCQRTRHCNGRRGRGVGTQLRSLWQGCHQPTRRGQRDRLLRACGVWQHIKCWDSFDKQVLGLKKKRNWEDVDFFCSKCRPPPTGTPVPKQAFFRNTARRAHAATTVDLELATVQSLPRARLMGAGNAESPRQRIKLVSGTRVRKHQGGGI